MENPALDRCETAQTGSAQSSFARIVVLLARLLLGLIFVVFGLNGFLHFIPGPSSIPGNAGAFMGAMVSSHYFFVTSGVQLFAGVLLLLGQYVPLALVLLAAVIFNILTFHITMMPSALFPMPVLVTILWFTVAWPLRKHFAPIFTRKT